ANQLCPEGLSASDTFVYATDFRFSSDSTNGFFLFRSPKCATANNAMSFQSGVQFGSDGKVYLKILGASLGVYDDKNYKDGTTHTLKIESSPDKVSVWIDEEKIFDNIEYNLDAVMAANDSENSMIKNEDGSYTYRTSYIYTDTTMYPAFGFYFNTVNVKVNNPLLYVSETAVIDKKLLDVKVQFKDDIRTYDNLFDGLTTDRVVVSLDGNTTVNTDKNGNVTFTTAGKNYIYYALGETIVAGNESGSGIGLYAKQLGPTGISTEDILIYETDFNISEGGKAWFTFRAPYSGNTGMACQNGVNITSSGVNLMILGATLETKPNNYADENTHTMKVKSGSDKVSVWIDGTLIFNDVDYDLDAVVAKTETGALVYSETTNGMKYEEGQYWYRGNALEDNVMYPAIGFFTGSTTEQMTISNPVLYEYDDSTSAKHVVRFIGSVDKLEGYESAGFILSTKDADPQFGNECKEITGITTVYSDLYVNGVLTSAKDIYGDEDSRYVFAYDVGNLPRGKTVYVRSYVQLSNGNIVLGDVRTITVVAPVLDDVYVSTSGVNEMTRGSEDKPFATLEYALKQVANNGTIHIVDSYTATSSFVWKSHEKQVTITGGTLDFSAVSRLNILDAVTFTDMTLNLRSGGHVFANGNSLKIDSNVTVNNVALIYGAGDTGTTVESTNITILAGTYDKIYGGGYEAHVQEDTTVYIGGNVNSGINATDHSLVYNLYGGSHNGTVGGNTNITVCDSAKFSYVYGGGRDTSAVTEKTSVKLQNNVAIYGVYGGSNSGTVGGTLVEMTGGTVYQIFGGSSGADVQGNTDVRITGGIIQRRIYGGCYNDYSSFTWKSSYRVFGNSSVTLGGTVSLAFSSSEDDIGLFATSRYKSELSNEKGTIIFNDGTYSSLKGKLGSQDTLGSWVVGSQEYHYLVDASGDGVVYTEGTNLRIVPKEGNTATITVNGTSTTLTSEGTYTLPTLSSNTATATIKVVFSQP
ncbi:MAG: hypothetical protein IJE60_10915, partial [Tyzzerella sp.]|nr:hypothetical protein [Tyzzerella sp.]